MFQISPKNSFTQVASWLQNSGIQSAGGGFYSWFDAGLASYSYLYSEITGYGISTLLFLYDIQKDTAQLKKAKRAAQWIKDVAMHPCGGIRTRLHAHDASADKVYSFAEENIFSFDTGMVLYGVINLYRVTQDSQYLVMAKTIADFLIGTMQQEDGSLAPIYNARNNALFVATEPKWSNQPASFHAKVALGLVDLFEVTGDKKYYGAAARLCTYALTTQEAGGRFITDKFAGTTHL
ncbi:MAG: glycoside hydrolase family 88 protein, partial [Candidatus Omnitrophica bacterium]|nr:glycoside hydrolase family 88 protein [Candidatus Omnitrophota bacterium]